MIRCIFLIYVIARSVLPEFRLVCSVTEIYRDAPLG
jgi:hypothetical protein